MTSNITNLLERISQMLVDSHNTIVGGYYYTQDSIDQDIDRPCFIVFDEGMTFENTTVDQDLATISISIAYVGQVFNGGIDNLLTSEYEELTREIAESAVLYMKNRPNLILSDQRGIFGGEKPPFAGVIYSTIDGRDAVTLYSRDGVMGEGFWGFTINMSILYQYVYTTIG